MGVYQFGGSLLVRGFVQVCEFDANPRAREPEIPSCRLDCHVLIGLSRSFSVVTGLADKKWLEQQLTVICPYQI